MLRLLILVGLVAVAWLLVVKVKRGLSSTERDARPGNAASPPKPAPMLACAHCGVHLPRPDALFDADGRPYCGEPHRVAGPR